VEVVGTEGSADPVRERGVVRVEFVRVQFNHGAAFCGLARPVGNLCLTCDISLWIEVGS
jgi:hypothetical protein